MTDDAISRIEAALEAGPTPGVWEYREVDGIGSVAAPKGWVGAVVADRGHECIDANYIAACNPVAIRTLLDRLKAAGAEVDRLRAESMAMRNQRDELRIVLDKRPTMNEGLLDAYAAWSASVYALDWLDAGDDAMQKEGWR
jgi:hypothetical protein